MIYQFLGSIQYIFHFFFFFLIYAYNPIVFILKRSRDKNKDQEITQWFQFIYTENQPYFLLHAFFWLSLRQKSSCSILFL